MPGKNDDTINFLIKNKENLRVLIAIMLFGVLVQLGIVFFVFDNPRELYWPDPEHYYRIAATLSEGGEYSTPEDKRNIYRAPGYPFLLSLVMRIFGKDILSLRLFHIALFPAFLFIVYRLGTALKNERVGLLAAALCAFYPLFLYVPLTLYPESVLIYLYAATALVLFYSQDRLILNLLLALLIAVAVMIRPTAIAWIPVAVLFVWSNKSKLVSQRFFAGCLIVILPFLFAFSWVIRNHNVHGGYVFTTSASSALLATYHESLTAEPESKGAVKGDLAKEESTRISRVIHSVFENPWKLAKSALFNCLKLWSPIPKTMVVHEFTKSRYKLINAVAFLPVLIFAIAGFALNWRNSFSRALLLLIVLNTIINGIAAVSVRYRVVTDFGLVLMAAYAVDGLLARYGSRQQLPLKSAA